MLNADDATAWRLAERTQAQLFWFSRKKEMKRELGCARTQIYFRDGRPNSRNHGTGGDSAERRAQPRKRSGGECASVRLPGCEPERIRAGGREFQSGRASAGVCGTVAGVDYYNDSKATNVDATIKALESFPGNIHLILGGKDKGSDYTLLNDLLRERVKRVYTIGAAAAKIESQIQDATEVDHAETLENAIDGRAKEAVAG